MRINHHTSIIALSLLVFSTASNADAIYGHTTADSGPGSVNQPRIVEVLVNSQDETITIVLEDSGPGPIVVELGGASSPFGNVTEACTEDLESSPQTIVCDFSDSGLGTGLPPVGDYLLKVSTGEEQNQRDEYDLTIGNQTMAGQTCPAGAYITGFAWNGDILCSGLGSGSGGDVVDPGEDDGAYCGNGIVELQNGEQCDDGNALSGDGCSASCQMESLCGDGDWSCYFD